MNTHFPPMRGYIAAVSAIILSAILTTLAFSESTETFWSRYSQLDQQNYEEAHVLASSCIYEALLQYKNDQTPRTRSSEVTLGLDAPNNTCSIDSVTVQSSTVTFFVHASVQGAYASVEAIALKSLSSGILSVTSWRDITSIPP